MLITLELLNHEVKHNSYDWSVCVEMILTTQSKFLELFKLKYKIQFFLLTI
jgi:hypothetical protein